MQKYSSINNNEGTFSLGRARVRVFFALLLALCPFGVLVADCENVHCRFEYLGHEAVAEFDEVDFLMASAVNSRLEKYLKYEGRPFRELNWYLNKFEKAVAAEDYQGCSNAVSSVTELLTGYALFYHKWDPSEPRIFPLGFSMQMMGKIEYCMARLVLGKRRDIAMSFFDTLLPDSLIDAGQSFRLWHSIRTFKNMLFIACAIRDYYDKEGCYPLNLNKLKLPERMRKCACGRDIEYEYFCLKWVLRSRCESCEGALPFDEYIPMLYQRKKLDLCFSPTYNKKRLMLYARVGMDTKDKRLMGRVNHNFPWSGVHAIKFDYPGAGCMWLVPRSEARNWLEEEGNITDISVRAPNLLDARGAAARAGRTTLPFASPNF